MWRLLPLLVGTMLSTPALALDACTPTLQDQRTRVCDYNPMQRYVINGLVGFPVNLSFGPNETIKRSEFSYTGVDKDGNPISTWKGPRCGDTADQKCPKDRFINNTPIWPFATGQSSLIVVTTVDGQERPYRFELIARAPTPNCNVDKADDRPGCADDKDTTDALSFTYSADQAAAKAKDIADKKQALAVVWRAKRAARDEQIAISRMKVDPLYGPQNEAYRAVGEKKYAYLAPRTVTDNGWVTEMQWPGNAQVPAIAIWNPVTNEEQSVTPDVQGQMHIIARTAEWFRLRIGKDAVLDIHNLGYKADRPDPHTGTSSPDVVRTVSYQGSK